MIEQRKDIQDNSKTSMQEYQELPDGLKEKIEWFKDQKIGVIFHWGLYSVAGIVESWQLSEEDTWARKKPWRKELKILRKDYWNLETKFNPTKFNPDDWAKEMKQAGVKYMLFTTKHHDGFNMYDTKYSEYKVTGESCPYSQNVRSDIFKEIAKAFRKKEIAVGAYYSKADWHSPLYWIPNQRAKGRYASYNPKVYPEIWKKFNQFVKNQLIEICKNYGKIDILWLDGGWVNSENNEYLDMEDIIPKLREFQPNLLVVDRTIGGKFENYVTPERKIPEKIPHKAWESNIPLAKNWGYVPNDQYKSFREILTSMIRIVSLGGNVIFGIGPKPDGTLPEKAQMLMQSLGEWLDIYGEGIYKTRPYSIHSVGHWNFTQKDQNIYAFYVSDKNQQVMLDISSINIDKKFIECIDIKTKEKKKIEGNKIKIFLKENETIGLKFVRNKEVIK